VVAGIATNASWLARALREPAFRSGLVSTAFMETYGRHISQPPDPIPAVAFAAAAFVRELSPKSAMASPWELNDGFRVGQPARFRVPLLLGDSAFDAQVVAFEGAGFERTSARVEIGGQTFRLFWDDESRPVQQWHEEAGPTAKVWVKRHEVLVWQGGEAFAFRLDDGTQFEAASAGHRGGLTTPLPGVVVSVAVKEGDDVTAGQTLLVIEAMKMEHAIKAPRAGKVRALKHRVGDRVREGSTLAEID
jgi:3-methylcrotonyl-CoA carboxylase alpha subunit